MRIVPTPIPGLLIIEPRLFGDERGFFLETYQTARYREAGIADEFIQDNQSRSIKNVLRGMHFQVKRPQAQLVTILRGQVFDVAVDLRPGSPTFGSWHGVTLDDDGTRQLYMAPGIAHGFYVLSDWADLHYKVSRVYDPHDEGGLLWNDPDVGIRWPVDHPKVTARDQAFPQLRDLQADRLPHDPPVERTT